MPQGFDTSTANHQVIDVKGASSAQDSKLYQGGRNHIGHQFSGADKMENADMHPTMPSMTDPRNASEAIAYSKSDYGKVGGNVEQLALSNAQTGRYRNMLGIKVGGDEGMSAHHSLKEALPGGTDRLIDSVTRDVGNAYGIDHKVEKQ